LEDLSISCLTCSVREPVLTLVRSSAAVDSDAAESNVLARFAAAESVHFVLARFAAAESARFVLVADGKVAA
jgi:hypothetical protein